ncbi:poly-beta-hydroxybutyrate polymerase [Betaproteobacteria bacterium]|nr:poly-beta-hydroxybutyrate polymerase [Betaproteobacteria bacterium]GHT94684.1 poly-beta-hydroxybutyrate polymerase [Betaproteobacteria bacterium]GHU02069.1 poly-beta-hydroxybutyrate polymerase [Betaproteobacteria bacterium]GHU12163.1 poly-beta-hydroxybutyrate polymerase [Betaproteobacteria bacterium]GHU21775.1 poly-beta-hydroxybutyrate polymerase [Betaproteobacteria bacterium]
MSDSNNNGPQQAAAIQAMLQAGQAMVTGFFDTVAKQHAAMQDSSGTAAASLPLPEAQEFTRLQHEFANQHVALWTSLLGRKPGESGPQVVTPEPSDRRFASPEWASSPVFDYLRQAYLINSKFLNQVADSIPMEDGRAKARVQFLTAQYVDALAPSNFAATNPDFIRTAIETKGESIAQGVKNLLADLEKGHISMTDESVFEVGRNLAITPGAVVYENELIQLIQYSPSTEQVAQTPLLIVPPCINKYYILDLQPENSLVRYIVEQGYTVFMVSWKNATAAEATLGWDDYVALGPLTALKVVRDITKVKKPNVLGFCVGGTVLASALAAERARGEDPVSSVTFLTTMLDFSDTGEIGCLVDEASVAAREASIGKRGLLYGQELANVFSFLRANDLVWQYVIGNYLKGTTPKAFDLLYWNSDPTNLPGPFMAWYLRNMYLENNLRVPGKLTVTGQKIDLAKIDAPAFFMAAREDHIVPWKTSYLGRKLLGGDTTFVLAASGHIAGTINPASKNKRSYWTSEEDVTAPDEWLEGATEVPGSWWPRWIEWLGQFDGRKIKARAGLGNANYEPIQPAPGSYVKEKA